MFDKINASAWDVHVEVEKQNQNQKPKPKHEQNIKYVFAAAEIT